MTIMAPIFLEVTYAEQNYAQVADRDEVFNRSVWLYLQKKNI
jgi:hypothetical protein